MATATATTNGRVVEETVNFEKGRIKALQDERLSIQKKTFTKWMNSFLTKARMEVFDLFVDLADGRKLLKLLEIISGEKLGKPNSGKMRVHHVENVNKSLAFLHTKVRLESIGAEDIVDGNPRLILGLIWTIILRFQIQEIEIDVDEENESSEKKSAKDALLLWCQRKTTGYPNVHITDFTGSWRSGLGFNALIHAHRPDLIDFDGLVATRHIDNLNNAFDVAENGLGINKLLDAEDIDVAKPDEKSILTYVASYYHTFARMKNEMKGGRRIANIVGQIMEAEDLKTNYELLTTKLLDWINSKIIELNERNFPNNLEQIQKQLTNFKDYRTVEKPVKYREKSEIEVNYFNINMRLKELNRKTYTPPDGKLVHDIEKKWEELEKVEHRREVALREELIRQGNLEQLAARFHKKADLRTGYLKDMIGVLSDPRYGLNLGQVEATIKKHEAISADILARENRCLSLVKLSELLYKEKYFKAEEIKQRAVVIMDTWGELIKLLEGHKFNLSESFEVVGVIKGIEAFEIRIEEVKTEWGVSNAKHLIEVEDLLAKQLLREGEVVGIGEGIRRLKKNYSDENLVRKLGKLEENYSALLVLGAERRARLEEARIYYAFLGDCEEEEGWILEKLLIVRGGINCKDLRGVIGLVNKLKIIDGEVRGRGREIDKLISRGRGVVVSRGGVVEGDIVKAKVDGLREQLEELKTGIKDREKRLLEAGNKFQFGSDANEVDSWLLEKRPLVESRDYGEDEPTAQALLQRHRDLMDEVLAYQGDINSLNSQANKLDNHDHVIQSEGETELVQKLLPEEYYDEEEHERVEYKTVTEERAVAQVKALYPFSGQELEMAKGEVLFLLNKTNGDWWNVRKGSGQDGFVPANYIKEIEPKVVLVQVRKPETVKEKVKVKKTRMTLVNVKVPKIDTKKDKAKSVGDRIKAVNTQYQELLKLGETRTVQLIESIKLHSYNFEVIDFTRWMKEKESSLSEPPLPSLLKEKAKFEKFLTDLSLSTKRLESLTTTASSLKSHPGVLSSLSSLTNLHENLQKLKLEKERSLKGASSLELLNRNCAELIDWIREKTEQIEYSNISTNLKTVQALQRKHLNLERELAPVGEKVENVRILGESVVKSYPLEKKSVLEKRAEYEALWAELQERARARREFLEVGIGRVIFLNSSRGLILWAQGLEEQMSSNQVVRDVNTAEELVKKHGDLLDDIKNHEGDFNEVIELGQRFKNDEEVIKIVDKLIQKRAKIHKLWEEKGDYLQQLLDLQMFNREADYVEGQSNEWLSALKNASNPENIDSVEELLKRQLEFENSFEANSERLVCFGNLANKLIEVGHFDSENINAKKIAVNKSRDNVKAEGVKRRLELEKCQKFYEFVVEFEDFQLWISEKIETLSHFNHIIVQKKLKKHEAFDGELRANEGRLKVMDGKGGRLSEELPEKRSEIDQMLKSLKTRWDELKSLSELRLIELRREEAGENFRKTVDDIGFKLDEIGAGLSEGADLGGDRRACKELLKKHSNVENEIDLLDKKIGDLIRVGELMKEEGHPGLLAEEGVKLKNRLDNLKTPLDKRRKALEQLLKFYDFVFEVESELAWIREKRNVDIELNSNSNSNSGAANSPSGAAGDLYLAAVLVKRGAKLLNEVEARYPTVNKIVQQGDDMVQNRHPEAVKIKKLTSSLSKSYTELLEFSKSRLSRLEKSHAAQAYYADAAEIESWLAEKKTILLSEDYGQKIEISVKLLTKHKTLELELDSYTGLISELGNQIKKNNLEYEKIQVRQAELKEGVAELKLLANQRRDALIEMMGKHEYFYESSELRKWITENNNLVESEEYGVDYEHLLVLRGKFLEVRMRILQGEERFKNLSYLAGKIIHHQDVKNDFENVGSEWAHLLNLVEARDHKLSAAGEIHRFNRDVADALARIQEKSSEISEQGEGKDVNSCESLIRLHETFENDLLPLEAQLQVLVDDAVRLSSLYPTNASNIREEQSLVIANWTELQNKTISKKSSLQSNLDKHRLKTLSRDLSSWSRALITEMDKREKSRDLAHAQLQMADHETNKSEIETRKVNFDLVLKLGQEIGEDSSFLKDIWEALGVSWGGKKVWLDQLIDLMIFLRDCEFLEKISANQMLQIRINNNCASVEEILEVKKKHDELEKVFATQTDKFLVLNKQGAKLTDQKHFDSALVKTRLEKINESRAEVEQALIAKRARILSDLENLQFDRDVSEAVVWVEEKKCQISALIEVREVKLEEKIKKLKKLKGFEAEVYKRNDIDLLLAKKKVGKLNDSWNELKDLLSACAVGLEEAQEILHFNNLMEKSEKWIRDKLLMVGKGEKGIDHEHCVEILKKLDELRIDEEDINEINLLGRKLGLDQEVKELNSKWDMLKGGLADYKVKLMKAEVLHRFVRDCRELGGRIGGKIHVVNSGSSSGSGGSMEGDLDLKGVEAGVRRMESVEVEVELIKRGVQALVKEGARLTNNSAARDENYTARDQNSAYENNTARDQNSASENSAYENSAYENSAYENQSENDIIRTELKSLQGSWHLLESALNSKRLLLKDLLLYSSFLKRVKDLELWSESILSRVEQLTDLGQVENELDLKKSIFQEVIVQGEELIENGSSWENEIGKGVGLLNLVLKRVEDGVKQRGISLLKEEKYQQFVKLCQEAELALGEGFLALGEERLGAELTEVQALIKEHDNVDLGGIRNKVQAVFDKAGKGEGLEEGEGLVKRDGKGEELEKGEGLVKRDGKGEGLVKKDGKGAGLEKGAERIPANEIADPRALKVRDRWELLEEKYLTRGEMLENSRKLLTFLDNLNEVESWISEKSIIASDQNYLELVNLQSKIQKHVAFEGEVLGGEPRVKQVLNEGQNLVQHKHYDASTIISRLEMLSLSWSTLKQQTSLKKDRLSEAYQGLLFNQTLEDLDSWMEEMETGLSSGDHGNNLQSVGNLLKKLTVLEGQWKNNFEAVEKVKRNGELFEQSDHFMKIDIVLHVKDVVDRYSNLSEPLEIRRENLEENLRLFTFIRDENEELSWLASKKEIFSSGELTSVDSIQNLQKKFDLVEVEIENRKTAIENLLRRAVGIGRETEVGQKYKELQLAGIKRKEELKEGLRECIFLHDLNEAADWIKEKRGVVLNNNRDDEDVDVQLKKFEVFKKEVVLYEQVVEKLVNRSDTFDNVPKITQNINHLKEVYSDLQKLCDRKKNKLVDRQKLLKYNGIAEELKEWISEQQHIAGSEDYGRDVEHVEILIQKFSTFLNSINNSGSGRVSELSAHRSSLIEEGHPEPDLINKKGQEVENLWEEFKELSQARKEALEGALKVHTFDRTADETIEWVGEKISIITNDEIIDQVKLNKVKRAFELFKNEVENVVLKQVEVVKSEGKVLENIFPDAIEHIQHKLTELDESVKNLMNKIGEKEKTLEESESVIDYLQRLKLVSVFVTSVTARVKAVEIHSGISVESAEEIKIGHAKLGEEIENKVGVVSKIVKEGEEFKNPDIVEKVDDLKSKWEWLRKIYKERGVFYEEFVDSRRFLRDLMIFENWLKIREIEIKEGEELGSDVGEVEELISKFGDFEVGVASWEQQKIDTVKRITVIEGAWLKLKEAELNSERIKREKDEKEAVMKREINRIERERVEAGKSNGNGGGVANGAMGPGGGAKDDNKWNLFGGSLRRGSDVTVTTDSLSVHQGPEVTRSESFNKLKPKRTPSFTTRRRTQSFRKVPPPSTATPPSPSLVEGWVERKQEVGAGGKRAAVRSWKNYYAILTAEGGLFFYKDNEETTRGGLQVPLFGGMVEKARDYTKRKFVWRFKGADSSEFLVAVEGEEQLQLWVQHLNTKIHIDDSHKFVDEDSSDVEGDSRNILRRGPRSREPLYANLKINDIDEEQAFLKSTPKAIPRGGKPPIPPRSSSIILESPTTPIHSTDSKRHSVDTPTQQHGYPSDLSSFKQSSLPSHYRPVPNIKPTHFNNPYHHVYSAGGVSTGSLPPGSTLLDHESSSESDSPTAASSSAANSKKEKRSSGLMGLFKRKKATQL